MLDALHAVLAATLALAPQDAPPDKAPAPRPASAPVAIVKPYPLEGRIEEPVLVGLDGKEHKLFAENEGKALVIVFWSWRDPVSRFYAPVLAELQAKHAERLTVLLVDPNHDELVGAGDPLAQLRAVLEKEKITLPVLLDRDNKLADDFDAKANAQAFLVDANRFLRYHGGIDDDPKGERRKKGVPVLAKLATAVDSVLAGGKPEYAWTIPAGRPIKRAPRAAPK